MMASLRPSDNDALNSARSLGVALLITGVELAVIAIFLIWRLL